jgi:ABC-type polysaccharide/polyol phosphate export permease
MMKRFFDDLIRYYDYEVRAAKSSLKTEVANSYLNWVWWILNPLFEMITYYLIFGVIFEKKEPYFPAFIFIGLTMWGFFSRNVTQSVNMIKRNKSIVAKVYVPKFVLLISNMMVNGFKMVISWIIVLIMLLLYRVEISWSVLAVVPVLIVLVLFTFGVSVNIMHYGVYVEDLSNVINILFKLLFYMTGIFYNIDTRIGGRNPLVAKLMTYCNPMAMLVHDMRNAMMYKTDPHWFMLLFWAIISILLSVIGVRKIYKNENSYVKVI